jgi:hypothetical protein
VYPISLTATPCGARRSMRFGAELNAGRDQKCVVLKNEPLNLNMERARNQIDRTVKQPAHWLCRHGFQLYLHPLILIDQVVDPFELRGIDAGNL